MDTRRWSFDRHFPLARTADLNQDVILDQVTIARETADIRLIVSIGNGAGAFARRDSQRLPSGGEPWFGDFDTDGKTDILVAGSMLSFLTGRGDGTFEAPHSFTAPGGYVQSAIVADFEGDGSPALIGFTNAGVIVVPHACANQSE